jgi:hypothetical protein
MDVERRFGLENAVGEPRAPRETALLRETRRRSSRAVREVENGSHPVETARDLDDVVHRPEIAHASHHLDSERHRASFASSLSRNVPS